VVEQRRGSWSLYTVGRAFVLLLWGSKDTAWDANNLSYLLMVEVLMCHGYYMVIATSSDWSWCNCCCQHYPFFCSLLF